jgi:hypothetical protein
LQLEIDLRTDLCTVAGSDVVIVARGYARTVAGGDVETIAGSGVVTVAGCDVEAVAGSDVLTVAGCDVEAVAGSGVLSVAGSDARTVAGSVLWWLARILTAHSGVFKILQTQNQIISLSAISSLICV